MKRKREPLVLGIVLLAVGIWMLIKSGFLGYVLAFAKKPVDISTLTKDNIKDGMRVEGDITSVYDWYMYYGEENNPKSRGFFIEISDEYMIGCFLKGEAMQKAYASVQSGDGENAIMEPVHIKGTVRTLKDDYAKYYTRYIKYLAGGKYDEVKDYFLMYQIEQDGSTFKAIMDEYYAMIIAGIIIIFFAIACIVEFIKARIREGKSDKYDMNRYR